MCLTPSAIADVPHNLGIRVAHTSKAPNQYSRMQ